MKWMNLIGAALMGGTIDVCGFFAWTHWQYWLLWLSAWSWAIASYYVGKWHTDHERSER